MNGFSLARVTHAEAVELFRQTSGPKCHLLVQRLIFASNAQVPPSSTSVYPFARPGQRATIGRLVDDLFCNPLDNTFEVTLNRGQSGLGLSLSGGLAEEKPIEINDIYPNQPAALSNRLHIGDVILAINDVPMHNQNVRVGHYFLDWNEKQVIDDATRTFRRSLAKRHEMWNYLCVDRTVMNTKPIWSVFEIPLWR